MLKGDRRRKSDSFAFELLRKSAVVRDHAMWGQSLIESEGVLANGNWYYFRARGMSASIRFAPSEKMEDICLSYFIKQVSKDWFGAGSCQSRKPLRC